MYKSKSVKSIIYLLIIMLVAITNTASAQKNIQEVISDKIEINLSEQNKNLVTKEKKVRKGSQYESLEILVNKGLDGAVNSGLDKYGLSYVLGYRFNPYFVLGGSAGIRYVASGRNTISIPLYLYLRTDILDRKVSPFFALNAGYNAAILNKTVKGIILDPTVGVNFKLKNISSLYLGIGYSFDFADYRRKKIYAHGSVNGSIIDYYKHVTYTAAPGGISLKLGFIFGEKSN